MSIGVPGFALFWSKTLNTPQQIGGIAAVCTMAAWLNTRNPAVKSLKDFTSADRIAAPGVKTSPTPSFWRWERPRQLVQKITPSSIR